MRLVLLAVLLFSCGNDQLRAVSDCGKPCYPGDPKQAHVGECHPGVTVCEDGKESVCSGYQLPAEEACDGLDSSCRGGIPDMDLDMRPCSSACGPGWEACIGGAWVCYAPQPKPEVCDGLDSDCDGIVDNPAFLPIEYCYEGPADTLGYGECRPGVVRCIAGQKMCIGEVLPQPEVCNGKDDNCQGRVDEDLAQTRDLDIVIIFDNSGSMRTVAETLKQAIGTWVAKYGSIAGRRYALVVAPDNNPSVKIPRLYQDMTDAQGIAAAIIDQSGYSGSGYEPTLEAMLQVLDGATNPLAIDWGANSGRVILVFSDEVPQSSRIPKATTDQVVAALGADTTVVLHVFTSNDANAENNDWARIAVAGRGQNWDIGATAAVLGANLDQAIAAAACQP